MSTAQTIGEINDYATLAEQAVLAAIKIYQAIEANAPGTKPLTDVLASADNRFQNISQVAEQEIAQAEQDKAAGTTPAQS